MDKSKIKAPLWFIAKKLTVQIFSALSSKIELWFAIFCATVMTEDQNTDLDIKALTRKAQSKYY